MNRNKVRRIIIAAYVLLFVLPTLWLAFMSPRLPDSPMHHYASVVAFNGGNPYDIQQLIDLAAQDPEGNRHIVPCLYPPTTFFIIGWAQWVDHDQVRGGWTILSHIALGATFLMLHRRKQRWEWLMILLIFWWPAWLAVLKGQVSLIMLCAVLWVTYAHSGAAVAFGGLLKVTPAGLLLWLARHWKRVTWRQAVLGAVLGLLGLGASIAVFGLDLHIYYVQEVMPHMSADQLSELGYWGRDRNPLRPNLNALFYQLPEHWGWLKWVKLSVVAGLFGTWLMRTMRRPEASAAALVAMILYFGPVTWAAHLSMLLLPAYVLVKAWRNGELSRYWKYVVGFGLVASSVNRDWFQFVQWYMPELEIPIQMMASLGVLSIIIATLYLSGIEPKTDTR